MRRFLYSVCFGVFCMFVWVSAAYAEKDSFVLTMDQQLVVETEGAYDYFSSNPQVASVDENGVITPHREGDAVITLTYENGRQYDYYVRVVQSANLQGEAARSVDASRFEEEVLRLVNEERTKAGVSPLGTQEPLSRAAAVRAGELIKLTGHTRPDGRECFSVLHEAAVQYQYCGENVAAGQSTPEAVVDAWMHSDGHRKNILNPAFKYIGVGYIRDASSEYKQYWAQLFIG